MSSTYYILCASHDPAIEAIGNGCTREKAELLLLNGLNNHPKCNLVIVELSGSWVSFGFNNYGRVKWVDKLWIQLLYRLYSDNDSLGEQEYELMNMGISKNVVMRLRNFLD